MMQTSTRIQLVPACLGLAIALVGQIASVSAADRTTFIIPLPHDAITNQLPPGVFSDEAFGEAASNGWKAYLRLWKAHYRDPSDATIRRFLGLPLKESFKASSRRGRSAPRWLDWRAGTYEQFDTPHFVIYSRADAQSSQRVAEDMERCYWVWTQMFFPLWEAGAQVTSALGRISQDESVDVFLKKSPARITVRRKLRVVLFRDAAEYQRTLARDTPGIERSTGFYNDEKQTTFLYAAEADDASTRRHEMVHQLFREATRSGLGRDMPGEKAGFWLIEGIAGYFESLFLSEKLATVGGWDSPRLQFARYRMLAIGDAMPMRELSKEGRLAVQQRQDIARWYAHSIAQTHQLLDGGDQGQRRWIYRQLALRYKIKADLPDAEVDLNKVDRSIRSFLSIDDAHIADNPARGSLQQLCLAGCQITEKGLNQIPPLPNLRWLDLSRLPIGNDQLRRLVPQPASLEQLSLEATQVDAGLNDWLRKATNLRELDLSGRPVDDSVINSVAVAQRMSILWMTATKISDQSIDVIAAMRNLESVDLQRTMVTDAGITRLRAARPRLEINPLQ